MENGRGGREAERKRGMAEEVRKGRKEEARQSGRWRKGRSEEARQGRGRKRELAPRAKLKSRVCNSSDLETVLY